MLRIQEQAMMMPSVRTAHTQQSIFFIVGVLALSLNGCVDLGGTWVTEQSVGQLVYRDLVGNDPSEDLLDRVTIKGVAVNERKYTVGSEPMASALDKDKYGFWIILTLSPRPWDLAFSPRELLLEIEQGKLVPAEGFVGPYRSEAFNPTSLLDAQRLNSADGPFPITKEVSIGVFFDIRPLSPGQHFAVVLKGLYRSGQPMAGPIMRFRKRTTYIDRSPSFMLCFHCGSQSTETRVVDE